MALESATYISDLVATNPVSGDNVGAGDDHVRLLKSTIKASFPGVTGAVTATHTELNILDGVTASTAELNILDGVTASTAELNYVDGVTSAIQTQIDAKVPLTAAGRWAQIGSTKTASASASITFVNGTDGAFDSTYDLYMIELIKVLPATNGTILRLRTDSNTGASYDTTSYDWGTQEYAIGDPSVQTAYATNDSEFQISGNINQVSSGSRGVSGHIYIWKPSDASYCQISWDVLFYNSGGAQSKISGIGYQNTTTDVDALQFTFSSGNIASGTFRLFGRVK